MEFLHQIIQRTKRPSGVANTFTWTGEWKPNLIEDRNKVQMNECIKMRWIEWNEDLIISESISVESCEK